MNCLIIWVVGWNQVVLAQLWGPRMTWLMNMATGWKVVVSARHQGQNITWFISRLVGWWNLVSARVWIQSQVTQSLAEVPACQWGPCHWTVAGRCWRWVAWNHKNTSPKRNVVVVWMLKSQKFRVVEQLGGLYWKRRLGILCHLLHPGTLFWFINLGLTIFGPSNIIHSYHCYE